ncbi:transglutaminase-like enzyme, predicted cysteine protease [Opitutaceae bacterium TAV1]|nr:transglutaminase [Opitutaceae bacterium TAV5]EIQ00814.1 transglutaminase-like enzyme, predicted cysteine protease [Opitutaceae bacterium TAV1]
MHLEISHVTRYEYDREVQFYPHLLYLRPRENPLLQVNRFAFTFRPEARVDWMRDDFDNLPASVQFFRNAATLEIRSGCAVTTTDTPPFDFLVRDYATTFPFVYEPLHRFNLSIYLTPPASATRETLLRWLDARFVARPRETVAWLLAFNQVINRSLSYRRRDEAGIQTALATITLGSGSCRDFAVLFIECARALGLAARFVSGYLFDPADNGSGSAAMHAWAEVFLPGAGWKGLDPTHGLFCDNAYVPVAHAVVAESVNPIQGSFFSAMPAVARLTTEVRVRRPL